jgi:1,4-dihydroxy-2-naphthoyl-CoA synthase
VQVKRGPELDREREEWRGTDYQNIHVEEKAEGIVVITLKRPEQRNAISIMMRQKISHCLEELRANSRIGGVIFTGAGSTPDVPLPPAFLN